MTRFRVFCTQNNRVTEGVALPFTCCSPPLFQIFFPLAFVRLPLSLHSSTEPTPRQAERPKGSNQLNYWEHKNAATNGSWINTLAKLLLWLPLLPRGIRLEILRLRTPCLEVTVEIFVCGGRKPLKRFRGAGTWPENHSGDLLRAGQTGMKRFQPILDS